MVLKKPKIGITLGDPAGIGPEVAINAILENNFNCVPILIGNVDIIKYLCKDLLKEKNYIIYNKEQQIAENHNLIIYDVPSDCPRPEPGIGNIDTAKESLLYIDTAINLWKNNEIEAIVTGPVNKGLIEKSGTHFIGHTEYFAEKMIHQENPYMLMFSEDYRVLLVTTHYPISKITEIITEEKICDTIKIGHQAIKQIDNKEPLIAVTGLDPHCGDSGAIGDFDAKVTRKAIEKCQAFGINVEEPLSADTLFIPSKWRQYDLAIAQYHDQGLIPFKMQAFESGVNVTLGLSVIRTSVDHGTAYDIAGQGKASFSSMVHAINLARQLIS